MTNAVFGFPRRTEVLTLSGGSWRTAYPLVNLQDIRLSKVARSTDATIGSTQIIATAANAQVIGIVALVGHNMDQSAQIRLTCWSDAGGTIVTFDSGVENVWPTNSYTAGDLDGANWTWIRRIASAGSAGVTVHHFQILITNTGNAAGYIQAGFLEAAATFDVTYNFEWGSQYGFLWRSQVTEAMGGAEYIDRRPKPRIFKGNFPVVLRSEAMTKFYEMQRQLDMNKPILFVPFPDETTFLLRTAMLARQMDPGLSVLRTRARGDLLDSVPIVLKEIIG